MNTYRQSPVAILHNDTNGTTANVKWNKYVQVRRRFELGQANDHDARYAANIRKQLCPAGDTTPDIFGCTRRAQILGVFEAENA